MIYSQKLLDPHFLSEGIWIHSTGAAISKQTRRVAEDTLRIHAQKGFATREILISIMTLIIAVGSYIIDAKADERVKAEITERYVSIYEDKFASKWKSVQKDLKKILDPHEMNGDIEGYDKALLEALGVKSVAKVTVTEACQRENVFGKQYFLRKRVDEIALHFRAVARCVDNGRCSEDIVNKYFRPSICSFRYSTFAYIEEMYRRHENNNNNGEICDDVWRSDHGDLLAFSSNICRKDV